MTLEPIASGLHESLVTIEVQRRLAALTGLDVVTEKVDPVDLPHVLARHVSASAHQAFAGLNAEDAVALANRLIEVMQEAGAEVTAPASQLLRVAPSPGPGLVTCP